MQTDVVLTVPADAAARTALLERLNLLAQIDHPRVEPVGTVRTTDAGTLVVTRRDDGTATDLATVLSVRGRCDPAEAASIAVAVAQGLAALHHAGIVHGPLDLGDVVVDVTGQPSLRPRLAAPEDTAGTAAVDVHLLARLVETLVGPAEDDRKVALCAALAPALAGDPLVRPEAGTLAARVADAVACEPVRLPEPAVLAAAALGRGRSAGGPDQEPAVRHRRARRARTGETPEVRRRDRRTRADAQDHPGRRRRVGARGSSGLRVRGDGALRVVTGVGAVALAVGALVVVGLQIVGPDAAPVAEAIAQPVATTAVDPEADPVVERGDPAAAAAELTKRRVALLAGEAAPADVALAGSAAYRDVDELVQQAAATGTRVLDAEVTVLDARTETQRDDSAQVVVEYVVEAHAQRSQDGTTTQVPATGPQVSTLHLAWTDEGWRVTDVR